MQQNAASTSAAVNNSEPKQFFTFIVNNQEYGVDIIRIQEIRGWTGVRSLPNLPPFIKGVIDLRGIVVPVIDLRERFNMTALPYNNLTVVVVLKIKSENSEQISGLIVDAVSEVYDIDPSQLQDAPEFGAGIETEFVKHLATVNEKLIIILDIDKLLCGGAIIPSAVTQPKKNEQAKQSSVIDLVERSFAQFAPKADTIVSRFYQELFRRHPAVQPMFANANIDEQKKKLITALQLAVSNLRNPDKLRPALQSLGKKHQQYGAAAAHYDAVATTLIDVLAEVAAGQWNDELKNAWANVLTDVKQMMLAGYEKTPGA